MKTAADKCMTCMVAMITGVAVADLPRLDSSRFDYKYDMIVMPSAQNLDDDGAVDFILSDSSKFSLGTGVNYGSVQIDTSDGGKYLLSGADAGSAGGAWRNSGVSAAAGYTVETRLKVTSTTGAQAGVIVLNASVDDTTNAWLKFWGGSIWWGETQIHNVDTTVYHTYRIVREAGSKLHSVYVDGALVAFNLGNGFSYSAPLKRLLIGSPGGTYKGKAQMMYVRFHKGGYAPPIPGDKKDRKWSGDFPFLYEMNAGDTRFNGPNASGTDWSGSVDAAATVMQDGKLSVSLPQGKMAYWRANNSVWSDRIGADTAYTVEFKVQIRDRWNLSTVGDRVIQIWCGNPRAAAIFYIGMSSVTWEANGAGTYATMATGDNTDAMHTFRVTYDGATRHGFTLWRDDVVIGECLVDSTAYNSAIGNNPNFLRFGVTSTSVLGGSFDVDYVRWTADGVWAYRNQPKGMVISVK